MASPPPPYIPTTLALRKLYEATGGSTWTYNANWLSGDPCGSSENGNTPWQVANNLPIGCTDGFPSTIYLNDNRLQGTLPTEIGLLRSPIGSLNINLRNNRISGTIPWDALGSYLGRQEIRLFGIHHNAFSGTIASSISTIAAYVRRPASSKVAGAASASTRPSQNFGTWSGVCTRRVA